MSLFQRVLKNYSKTERRFVWVVFFILFVLALSFVGEYGCTLHEKSNWQQTLQTHQNNVQEYLTDKFSEFEQEMIGIAERCAEKLQFLPLTSADDSISQLVFATLESLSSQGTTIEVYDNKKNLIAWSREKGIDVDTSKFFDERSFSLIESPLYTYAICILPFSKGEVLDGYVVVKKFFDVNYPLGNRYINNEMFASSFSSKLDVKPRFIISEEAITTVDTTTFVVPLKTQGNHIVGYAMYDAPRLDDYISSITDSFQRVRNILYVFLSLCVLSLLMMAVSKVASTFVKMLAWTIVIWLFRYILVWSDVVADNIQWDIFQPSYFASSFGFGIARSVGDLLVTSIFLLGNVLIAFSLIREQFEYKEEKENLLFKKHILVLEFVQLSAALAVVLFSRGYAAVVRSAVFDSTLQYYNPFYIIPTFPLGLMLLCLLLITVAFVFASYGLILVSFRMTRQTYREASTSLHWLLVLFRFVIVSFLFGIIHPNPLLSQTTRLVLLFALVSIVFFSIKQTIKHSPAVLRNTLTLLVAFSVLFLLKTMDEYIHENDKAQVELLARSINRPIDSWMTFTVSSALDEVSQPTYVALLLDGTVVDREKLAFKAWANSQLSREEYNCAITYVDTNGNILSDFHLGEVHHKSFELHRSPKSMEVEEHYIGGLAVKTYRASTPLVSSEGKLLGGVFVEVTANRQALFSRESPEILRQYTVSDSRTQSRAIVYSEYHKGELAYSSSENFPHNRTLTAELQKSVMDAGGMWIEEVIEGKRYESYYFTSEDGIVVLSMEYLTVQWYLFVLIRVILFFLLIFIGILSLVVLVSRFRQKRFQLNVRTKLLLAFIIISFIPIAILAYYNRVYALERSEKNLASRLQDETELVVSSLQNNYGYTTPSDLDRLTDDEAEHIADDINLDFNLFRGIVVSAASKPEVFAAELFDERLSSDAYLNLMIKKKNFFFERRSIGTLSYLVGYRPLHSQSGDIIGIVSVPTIFRQRAVYDELLERNAYLFSVYAIALILSLGFGWLFANQISAPVRRLQQAARRISTGDLNVRIATERTDEFGELEQTFDTMVHDLKESQERLVRVQREQAWKEMAKQVAHEIKNPLTPMKLSIQHLRQAYNDGVKDFGNLLNQISETVLGQIESLSKIASEFSHFARMPERTLEECDVHQIVYEAANLFQQHKDLKFSFLLKASKSVVQADKEELRRAFINIIRNAVQAMDERGRVTIETGAIGGIIEIRITDTGPGIAEEIRDKLFEPNFSTKTEGMGLGLAIVKKVIDDTGGTIFIESVVGKGTTVVVQLPIMQNHGTETRNQ